MSCYSKITKLWKFYLLLLHKDDVCLLNFVDFTTLFFKWHRVTDCWWIIYLEKGLYNLKCTKKNVHTCMTICTQKSECIVVWQFIYTIGTNHSKNLFWQLKQIWENCKRINCRICFPGIEIQFGIEYTNEWCCIDIFDIYSYFSLNFMNVGFYHGIRLMFHMFNEFTRYFGENTFQCNITKSYPQNCVLKRWWKKNQSKH